MGASEKLEIELLKMRNRKLQIDSLLKSREARDSLSPTMPGFFLDEMEKQVYRLTCSSKDESEAMLSLLGDKALDLFLYL